MDKIVENTKENTVLLSIRGATVCDNTAKSIQSSTEQLYKAIIEANNLNDKNVNVTAVFVSMTKDLTASFAAAGLRGLCDCAIFSSSEPEIEKSLPFCIRLLVQVNVAKGTKAQHIYQGGAKTLRPDISKFVIALDGPSGSGKSSLARLVSQNLGIMHLDSGALFRSVAVKLIECGFYKDKLLVDDERLTSVLQATNIVTKCKDGLQRIFLDDKDISSIIRQHEVSKATSDIAINTAIREYVKTVQYKMACTQSLIVDGRDIGTVVFPNTEFKFFVVASIQERAIRRQRELKRKGHDIDLNSLISDIQKRDFNDSNREVAPLKQARDAILIDTTSKKLEQSSFEVLQHIYSTKHNSV
ncbi:MAG: (d)CMP kinase [Clostridiales bacterium]|jgi:cytidylate kinase|nr:(d)CMP kinase [Clostridiales bacterium]